MMPKSFDPFLHCNQYFIVTLVEVKVTYFHINECLSAVKVFHIF
jgi:hypothetical protein